MTSADVSGLPRWQEQILQRFKEAVLIVLAVICVYLWMILLSFDAEDPGFNSAVGGHAEVSNAGGLLGAWLADLLLSVLGYFAWILPLIFMLKTVLLYRQRNQPLNWKPGLILTRTVGTVMLVLGGAGLSALHFATPKVRPDNFNILGEELAQPMLQWLNQEGATLVLLGLFMIGFTLFTNLSWFRMMELLGQGTLQFSSWLGERVRHILTGLQSPQRDRQQPSAVRVPVVTDTVGRQQPVVPAMNAEQAAPAEAAAMATPVIHRAAPVVSAVIPPVVDSPPVEQVAVVTAASLAGQDQSVREPEQIVDSPLVFESLEPAPEPVQAPGSDTVAPVFQPAPEPVSAQPIAQPMAHAEMPQQVTPVPVSHVVDTYRAPPAPELPVAAGMSQASAALVGLQDPVPLPELVLDRPEEKQQSYSDESLQDLSRLLEIKLKEFGVKVQVESVHPGPVVTRFEIELAPGLKVSRITNLAKDLARSMAMLSVRVVEVIPGKTTVGIEVPNEDRQIVRLAEVLETEAFEDAKSPVALGLGHDIGGQPVIADLAKMPHLLVAGTTGSGKSVGVNAMILSMLFKSTPDDVRLIMIDPKMLELSIYEGIPHLLCPVVTDMKEAANALRWCVAEMERRYKLMAKLGVRNLAGYNRKVKEAWQAGTPLADPLFVRESPDDMPPALEKLPTIVVVVDEFADMMMMVGKKVEELIARIAQKARAAGIHLILATQRPSVDVITGLIKANIPTRMAFQVSSKIDSRTILDQGGAEQLLGYGDMLYLPPGTSLPIRVHGAFVADDEVHRVVDAWKERGVPEYIEEILAGVEEADSGFGGEGGALDDEMDPLYDEAVRFVTETRRVSISSVQRKLKVGYNRAARMVDAMEAAGVISSAAHNGSREVLAPPPVVD